MISVEISLSVTGTCLKWWIIFIPEESKNISKPCAKSAASPQEKHDGKLCIKDVCTLENKSANNPEAMLKYIPKKYIQNM